MSSKTLPEVRKSKLPYIDRSREMAWLEEHEQEYAGQWVLLWGDRLVAHGDDLLPLRDKALAEGIDRPLVVHCRTWFGPVMGGWL
jgi:hypothetical protein